MVARLPKPVPKTAYLRRCHYRVASLPCVAASIQGSFISSESTKTGVKFTPVFVFTLIFQPLCCLRAFHSSRTLYPASYLHSDEPQSCSQPSSCLCQIWYPGLVPLSGTQRSYQVLPVSFCRLGYIA